MRDFEVTLPPRRVFVRVDASYTEPRKRKWRNTIYIEAGPAWRKPWSFQFLVKAVTHESIHLVLDRIEPRLRIKSGVLDGMAASEAYDQLPQQHFDEVALKR